MWPENLHTNYGLLARVSCYTFWCFLTHQMNFLCGAPEKMKNILWQRGAQNGKEIVLKNSKKKILLIIASKCCLC